MSETSVFAVIVDLVDSRKLDDRAAAQHAVEAAFDRTADVDALDPLRATVGDEFQTVYATLADALVATTAAILALPPTVQVRLGIGRGPVRAIGDGAVGPLQDGPGWWSARDAINETHRREDGRTPFLRSWYHDSEDRLGPTERLVDAWFLSRDHVLSRLTPRARRVALGLLQGRTQAQIAAAEGITPSAVSQSVQRSGVAAVVEGLRVLADGGR
ncbi:SatD family protein [Curtobacterium sp. MCLR17_036]|uniref:SatD family protein n=1 Tax=Curtobacterium sp. MCLR17_036 TaxID=2175620 RepID=UPI000DA99DEB|nr:SatD family protein [Curtobacterium sp. MCLR17_036]WIE66421.1 SatD family protein [Curtobacterium sp. MCLR17_036]